MPASAREMALPPTSSTKCLRLWLSHANLAPARGSSCGLSGGILGQESRLQLPHLHHFRARMCASLQDLVFPGGALDE